LLVESTPNPHPDPLPERERGKSLTIDEDISIVVVGGKGCGVFQRVVDPHPDPFPESERAGRVQSRRDIHWCMQREGMGDFRLVDDLAVRKPHDARGVAG